ncbi:MAG: glycosyltransferase [Planctomycetaceae bacterium]
MSVVVPTYKEVESLPELIERLTELRRTQGIDLELLIMDDDSRDGSEELVRKLNLSWVRLIVRTADRGLSAAVLEGLKLATRDTVVVMDADLSHPPERIPAMLEALDEGSDFVIGSRYVDGGTTGEDWGFLRWLNSKAATWLARPFTRAADPMSGFFAFRREALARAPYLNPVGYKIGLELLVKCGFQDVREIPISFAQRKFGESKLSIKEQVRYLQHLRRLLSFKFPFWSHALQFGMVGATGVIVNLVVLTSMLWLGAGINLSVVIAIATSMVSNFALNRRFTFSEARDGSLVGQLVSFIATCLLGAAVNYAVTMAAIEWLPGVWPQVASLIGIAAGMVFNFLLSRYVVFRA